jgi:hypothetical protein
MASSLLFFLSLVCLRLLGSDAAGLLHEFQFHSLVELGLVGGLIRDALIAFLQAALM